MIKYICYFKVGLFYKTEEWIKEKFDYLTEQLKDQIERRDKNVIILKNGFIIQAVPANTRARGCKFDKILCQEGIDSEILNTIIKPSLIFPQIVVWKDEYEKDA